MRRHACCWIAWIGWVLIATGCSGTLPLPSALLDVERLGAADEAFGYRTERLAAAVSLPTA